MSIKLIAKPTEGDDASFESWARAKYNEISKQINPCDENGNLDPQRLNSVLTKFSQSFAWAITIQEIETNRFNILSHEHDSWYKERYNESFRSMQEETGGGKRAPGQVTIEARIVQMHNDELVKRQTALEKQRSRVDLLKGFVKVLDRQASILQTLSSNMRSELFFAAGVNIKSGMPPGSNSTDNAKTLLRNAMKSGDTRESDTSS